MDSIISAGNLKKHYRFGPAVVKAVDGVDIEVRDGEFLSIVGASGSGKSTLLNLLAGLDTPTEGRITVPEGDLGEMNPRQIARYRAFKIGMVFQSFNLIPHRTALSNVELALFFTGDSRSQRRKKAAAILSRLGLGERLEHKPSDLSGGEQQRVALARALVKDPKVLFADEPTGNLDRDSATAVADILREWNGSGGTVVMVTHNLDLAEKYGDRILKMDYGKLADNSGSGRDQK
ncbi:MAG: ABC transporter ATP-binding protein [FCB group bacterium]|nr:ABC transporter ATP-binding protein [FCB group bacterium]